MSSTILIATKILAIPTSTNMSLLPPPPPPPPPSPLSQSGSGNDDESDDEYHDDEHTESKPLQPLTPNTATISSNPLSPSSSTLAKSTISTASAALAVSSSSSASTISEGSVTKQTALSTTVTSSVLDSSAPSSLSQSESIEPRSTMISSTTPVSSLSTPGQSSAATVLPIGRPDSSLEAKVGSSPLGTAGIILAGIFGFIALVTTIYLLHRLRRRRKTQDPSGIDSEKQNPLASTTQETGIIFGRNRNDSRSAPNLDMQSEGRSGGWERSRFSFLNRSWYSTGTQLFSSQQQQQTRDLTSHTGITTANFNINDHSPSPRWPSPICFSLNRPDPTLDRHTSPLTNRQYYPSVPILATPQTATTITRLVTDIQRNISTRSSGSGHTRAYAHHGIRAPHHLVINAARNTILSISSLLIRARLRNRDSKVSDMTSRSPRTEGIGSPVSEISELYHGDVDRSPRVLPPPRQHSSDTSSHLDSPVPSIMSSTRARPHGHIHSHWSSTSISTSNLIGSISTPNTDASTSMTSPPPRTQRQSRTRFTDMPLPQLPLPVVVSRGSWGSKIGIEV